MVAHSMELDELLFSSFFMDHGNNNELKENSSNLGVFGTPYTVAENFIAKEDGFLNLYINPSTTEISFAQVHIGTRYSAGNGNFGGQQYNIFTCVKKGDRVTFYGDNATNQTWTFIPLSSK